MASGSNNQKDPKNNPYQGRRPVFNIILTWSLIALLLYAVLSSNSAGEAYENITYDQMISVIYGQPSDQVEMVEITDTHVEILLKEGFSQTRIKDVLGITSPDGSGRDVPRILRTGRIEDSDVASLLSASGVPFRRQESSGSVLGIVVYILPYLIVFAVYGLLFWFFTRRLGSSDSGGVGGFMSGVSKSKAKRYNVEKNVAVTFKDVAGQDEAKESLDEILDFLDNPEKYTAIGAKQPKGALLIGPPGTGKTLLARALAGEAKVPFYHLTGSEFIELYVGVGASRVRDLFSTASKDAPCIVFIDEIDAIGKSRDNPYGTFDERDQTLNQLLAEMDGFDTSKGVVVLAATNRPEVLDKALLRPGRFDRRIIVEKPDLPGREAILSVHAGKLKMSGTINLREIAQATSGATGADLANIINEAALRAVRLNRDTVLQEDLVEAVELVIAGKEKKDRILSQKEKELVSYHEVGHALVSCRIKNSTPVQKITIVPRTMGTLGYTMNTPEEDRYLMTREELLDQISMLLGGRAAELVCFSTTTTGATNDIERATAMARNIVTVYGMSEKFGPAALESTVGEYLDGRKIMNCSDKTGGEVDEEVQKILAECQETAVRILEANRASLDRIARYLLERENMTGEEFTRLLAEDTPANGPADGSAL